MRDSSRDDNDSTSELATQTLAEIYLSQGHTEEALTIYRRLHENAPDEEILLRRVRVLEQRLERERHEQRCIDKLDRLKRLLRRVQRRRNRA